MLSQTQRPNNAATLTLLSFLRSRSGLDNVEAIAFHPLPGAISPADDQIIWSGLQWELIKDFCPMTGEFKDFLLWNRRECCGVQIADEWDWSGWDGDDLIEDTQSELVNAIATFENQQNSDANVHQQQLSLFEVAA